ncbi:hypothetical protein FOA52_016011 [Chlamydomonas sp. UWO 241]|nr:hypothetical protein FOA52_016011 [Chlamydomonas sp. UWO 241]
MASFSAADLAPAAALAIEPTSDHTRQGLRACIKPCALKPTSDPADKAWLKQALGWKEPVLLMAYSRNGQYKTTDWTSIRGTAVVMHADPPMGVSLFDGKLVPDAPGSGPKSKSESVSAAEMVETLLFFKGKDTHKIARKRDKERTMRSMGLGASAGKPTRKPRTIDSSVLKEIVLRRQANTSMKYAAAIAVGLVLLVIVFVTGS